MNPASAVTAIRIALAPVFYLIFTATAASGSVGIVQAAALWLLFIVMEVTDFVDGAVARKTGTVSDFGKVFDPFADSFARLTYFCSFAMAGIMPGAFFLLVLYRDITVAFIRLLAMKKGVAMGAQLSGKIKAWVYAIGGGSGIALVCARSFLPAGIAGVVEPAVQVVFALCAITAVWTTIDYALAYRRMAGKA